MQIALALNIFLGSAVIIVMIFADYIRKYNPDHTQKNIFISLLILVFIPLITDFLFYMCEGIPGKAMLFFLYGLCFVYYLFQILSFCISVLFLDYMVFRDSSRVKKIVIALSVFTLIHLIILLLNLKFHFYYYIDETGNVFCRGDAFFIKLIFSYCTVFFIFYEIAAGRKILKKNTVIIIFLLLGLAVFCSAFDVIFGELRLIWPGITAALLCFYFFIIQTDTKIDSLTGIGNRYSFNEFTERLSKSRTGETWTVVMIDLDNFKEINDKLGHREGDNALRDVANIIKNSIRGSDFSARYGGDEFVLATRAGDGFNILINRILEEIKQLNKKNTRPFKIEISYGCDVYVADGSRSIDDFLSHIDGLMYKYKEERRRAGDKINGAQS